MQSAEFSHMTRPTAKTIATMKKMEEELRVVLPLDAEGKMTCATCHNPHEKGVISAESPAATGAGSKYRLRLPEPPCIACHEMEMNTKKIKK
jgi:cytochrome c peroxidase